MKKLATLILTLICYVSAFAQAPSIQNIYFNNSVTYSAGSTISVHFQPTGIFPKTNKFTLQLLDNAGTVVINNNIGSVNEFFSPVLNGVLPAGLAPGNYTLKIVADNGGAFVAASGATAVFTVSAATVPVAPAIGNPSTTIKVNCFNAPYYYFGYVDRAITDVTQALTFQISNYSAANTYTVKIINPASGVATTIPVTVAFGAASFTLPAGLPTGYYTVEVAANNGSATSTTAYTYLFNTGNTSLGNTSSENVCANDTVHFAADLAVILKNYPGSYYLINYGDGSGTDTLTHAQMLLNSLKHVYGTPTCLAPDSLIQNGTYKVTLFLFNKGIKVGANQNCDTYSRNGNGTFKFVNTSSAPIADMAPPEFACINTSTTVYNTSIAGFYGSTNVCERQMNVTWYLQPPSGSSFSPVPAGWSANAAHNLIIPAGILNETGVWRIKLVTQNPEGCITSSEDTGSMCIEPLLLPDFKLNGEDSLSGCAPFGVTINNITNSNPCRPVGYSWSVLDSSGAPAPITVYSITGATQQNPGINFFTPGRYFISLEVSNSCGIVTKLKPVNVLGVTNVIFPSPKRYCGITRTIDFATDAAHKPVYDQSAQATQSYSWSVSGGTHSFINGTTATDRYPTILFSGAGVYFVQLTYTNSCGSKTVSQRITLDQPLSADAGIAAQTICYNQDTVHLTGTAGGNGSTSAWTAFAPANPPVTGSFSSPASLNTVYTFSQGDKTRNQVWLIFKVFPDSGVVCSAVSDTMRITIKPKVYANDGTKSICTGNAVNYAPTGSDAGASYTWTSTVLSGTVTGNGAGAGTINDILLNTANTDAIVVYKIIPTFNGCTGDTGTLTVTIHPTPVATPPTDLTVCRTAQTGNLNFSSTVSGTGFNWTNSDPAIGLAASGTGNIPSFTAVNNSATDKTATITVTPVANGCNGSSASFTITVKPGPPAADAGPDQLLCAATSASLNATSTSATGTWSQTSGPAATITSPGAANSTVTGLAPDNSYRFVWTITDGSSCPATTDTVTITNRPVVTAANAGSDTTYCHFTAAFARVLSANTPAHSWENGQWSIASNTTGITPVFSNVFLPGATLSGISLATGINSGVITLVWTITNDASCSPSRDTVVININRKPAAGNITPVNALCRNSNTTLTLNNYEGNILKWRIRYAPFNTGIFQDTLLTTPVLQLNNLQDSAMVQAIVGSTGAGCAVTDTAFAMIPVNAPSIGGTTLKDSIYCLGTATGVVTLSNHNGTINWQQSTDNGLSWNFISGQTAASVAFNNLAQTTWYRAIVQSAGCTPDTSTVTKITLTNTPGASDAGADKILCAADSVLLTGNAIPGAVYTWKQIGGLARTHSDSTQNTMWVYGLQSNQPYQFLYSLSNGICPASRDTISIISYAPLVNTITPVQDTVCSGQPVTVSTAILAGGKTDAYTFQWQTSFDGNTWTNAATTQSYTFTPSGSVYLRRFVTAGPCAGYSDTAFIVVEQTIGNNVITGDDTICVNTVAGIIAGSIPAGGSGNFNFQWQQSSDGGATWSDITGANAKDLPVQGVLSQTMKYRRNVTDTRCGSAQSNVVTILVRPDAVASFLPTTFTGCTPFSLTPSIINLQPDASRNGAYEWYANNVLIGTGQNFPGYTLLNDNDSVDIKLRTISLYGCKSDSVVHRFITYPRPAPDFSINTNNGCGPLTVAITNNTVHNSAFTYRWNFGNGQVSSAKDPGSVVYQPAPTYNDTTYTITLTVLSTCDTLTVSKTVTVKSTPKALFAPDRTVGCSPFMVVFSNNSLGNATGYTWDFGDGTIATRSTRDTISHVFHTGVRDTFYVKLKAANGCGVDSLVYNIIVSANTISLDFAVNGNQQQGCAPHTVSFVNNSAGATAFQWTFGDGNNLNTTRNIDTVTHTFQQPGVYQVLLRATNGCSDTTGVETITVYPKPAAAFTVNAQSGCIGNTFNFTNSSDSATSYLWDFGDGITSSLTNPSHVYATAGVFTVKLTAFRVNAPGNTCSDTVTRLMQIVATLPGSFTASDTLGFCLPFTPAFTNTITPAVSSTWNFGDGQTGTGNSVQHTYHALGNYTVTLTTVVPGGCTYVSSKQVVIAGPNGQFLYNGGYVCENADARFEVTVSNTDSVTYIFGDGQTLTTNQLVVYHHYTNPGLFVPKVVLKSNAGCSVTINGIDTIRVDNADAGFTAAQLRSCGSTLVNFADTSHIFFGKANVQWFFGDGGVASGNSVSHVYTSSGTYSITQIVTSNSGCRDTIQRPLNVIVFTKPGAAIAAPATGCVGQPVVFNANVQTTDPLSVIKWTVSNGVTGNAANLTVNFSSPGIYTIQLVAGTVNGCFDTVSHNILINPTPNVIASADLTLCRGNAAPLNAIGATQYEWSPVQGLSCINCPNPVASPLTTTSYVVKGTNSFGCSSTDTILVTVMQPFTVNVSGSDSICTGSNSTLVASGGTTYNWSPGASLSSSTTSTVIASPTATTTYRVIGFDGANCFTDTAFVTVAVGLYPVVNLGPDQVVASGTAVTLIPVVQNGPIATWVWSQPAGLSCSSCAQPVATIFNDVTYKVKATTAFGCSDEDTIRFKTFCLDAQTFIPNAFTPDGDGINDILMVRGSGIVTVKSFRIFNRWGEVVFERSNFAPNNPAFGWDGKINGIAGGPDVFVYTADVVCGNGTTFTYKGNVSILK